MLKKMACLLLGILCVALAAVCIAMLVRAVQMLEWGRVIVYGVGLGLCVEGAVMSFAKLKKEKQE